MSVREFAPHKVLNHAIILVLPSTVVSMHVHILLAKPMILKEVVYPANNSTGTFTTVQAAVDQKDSEPAVRNQKSSAL